MFLSIAKWGFCALFIMDQTYTSMQGKICLVTGATSGIGKSTALGLARQGATVVIVGRNQAKGEAARQEIQTVSGNPAVDLLLADLSSQESVRQLAATFLARYDHLHVLINNAGVFLTKRHLTVDGLEMTFAVNHLAPFLLTHLLLDRLKENAPARIVNVCSGSHYSGHITLDDLQLEKGYNFWRAYSQSKLAMILCAHKRVREFGGQRSNPELSQSWLCLHQHRHEQCWIKSAISSEKCSLPAGFQSREGGTDLALPGNVA